MDKNANFNNDFINIFFDNLFSFFCQSEIKNCTNCVKVLLILTWFFLIFFVLGLELQINKSQQKKNCIYLFLLIFLQRTTKVMNSLALLYQYQYF